MDMENFVSERIYTQSLLCSVVRDKSDTFAQRFHFLHCDGFKDPTGRV